MKWNNWVESYSQNQKRGGIPRAGGNCCITTKALPLFLPHSYFMRPCTNNCSHCLDILQGANNSFSPLKQWYNSYILLCMFILDLLFSSLQFSRSVVSNSLGPHEPQHARPPCPSPAPRVHPNPCPLSQWHHLIISSSVIPFCSCLQSFPASGPFLMSKLFT